VLQAEVITSFLLLCCACSSQETDSATNGTAGMLAEEKACEEKAAAENASRTPELRSSDLQGGRLRRYGANRSKR